MNLELLETFQNLAKTKNFSRTAELMYLSQSTVTQRIKMLENELGKELVDRKGKGLHLTLAGEMLLEYADKILQLCDDCVSSVNEMHTYDSYFVIESQESVWYSYLYPPIVEYMKTHPNTSMQLHIGHSDNVIDDLVNGIVDIGTSFVTVKNKDIEVIPYFQDGFELVASPNFQMNGKDQCITPQNISDYRFVQVLWGEKFNEWWRQSCGYKGYAVEATQVSLLLPLLYADCGISFLPNRNARKLLDSGELVRVPFDFGTAPPQDEVNLLYMKKNKDKLASLLEMILSQGEIPKTHL